MPRKDSFVPSALDARPHANPEDLNRARKKNLQRENEHEEPCRGVKKAPRMPCHNHLHHYHQYHHHHHHHHHHHRHHHHQHHTIISTRATNLTTLSSLTTGTTLLQASSATSQRPGHCCHQSAMGCLKSRNPIAESRL